MYQIPCSVYDLRTKVREQFEKNKHVTDVRVIDVLILKGRQEFQESINYWKTPVRLCSSFDLASCWLVRATDLCAPIPGWQSHIMGWFNEQEVRRLAPGRGGSGGSRRPVRCPAELTPLLFPFSLFYSLFLCRTTVRASDGFT